MSDLIKPTDWKSVPALKRRQVIRNLWNGLRRRTLEESWDIGCGLVEEREDSSRGDWSMWLDDIGMTSSTAHRMMNLAKGYGETSQLGKFLSVDAALKALPPKRPPEPKPIEPAPKTDQELVDDAWESEAQSAVEEVAQETQAEQNIADREIRDERLAKRLENTDGEAVDVLSDKLDASEQREAEARTDINSLASQLRGCRKKNRDVCDALLLAKPDTALEVIDETLATFYGVARKGL